MRTPQTPFKNFFSIEPRKRLFALAVTRALAMAHTLAVAIWLACFPAVAGAVSVVMQNGDQLSGEIDGLADSKLALKTGYAGTIRIAWDQIAELTGHETKVMVEVETGRRYAGSVEKVGERLYIQNEDVRAEVQTRDVVAMVPMTDSKPPGFWQLLQGSFDVGYSFTRGNSSQTQSSVGARGQYRTHTYKAQGRLSSIFSETDDADPTSRHAVDGRLDRFLTPKMFAFGLTGFERNERQKLDLRSKFGGGFGWTLLDTKRTQLSLLGGFTYTNEQFRAEEEGEEPPRSSTGEGLVGVEWETNPFLDVRFSTKLSVHPNVVQSGRYRVEYDSSLRIPLLKALTFSVSVFDRYDNRPPTDVKRNDYGLISAFGFAF
jgi:putative salt-induced outer membrane protein YdiY